MAKYVATFEQKIYSNAFVQKMFHTEQTDTTLVLSHSLIREWGSGKSTLLPDYRSHGFGGEAPSCNGIFVIFSKK